jgi:hypothetical protein
MINMISKTINNIHCPNRIVHLSGFDKREESEDKILTCETSVKIENMN